MALPGPPKGLPPLANVYPNPLHEILDPHLEIHVPLENAGNAISKTLDFKIFLGVGVPTIFYQPSTSKTY